MTNGLDLLPSTCCSPGNRGADLLPLLAAAAVLVGVHFANRWFQKRTEHVFVKNAKNIVIIAVLLLAVAAVVVFKQHQQPATAPTAGAVLSEAPALATPGIARPRLVDLGADKCVPCKMMAPILEDLKKTYKDKLVVEFIDVWKNPDAAKPYQINLIPTQIFYSSDGKELFRHEGFFAKEDILAKWKEFGVELAGATQQERKQP